MPISSKLSRRLGARVSAAFLALSLTACATTGEQALRAVPRPDGTAPRALVLGSTGYIGGRLVPRLLAAGYRVRVLVRDPARLAAFDWGDEVEVVAGSATDAAALADPRVLRSAGQLV